MFIYEYGEISTFGPEKGPERPGTPVTAFVLKVTAGVRNNLRSLTRATAVEIALSDNGVFHIPYNILDKNGVADHDSAKVVADLLEEKTTETHGIMLKRILENAALIDDKIWLDDEKDASLVLHAIDTFPCGVRDNKILRREVLRFFTHSKFSSFAAKEDEQVNSYWWYIFCRLLISLQKLIQQEVCSPDGDWRNKRLLIEDALAGWIGKMSAMHPDTFSHDSLLSSLSKISSDDRNKIADANIYVMKKWQTLVAGYSRVATETEVVTVNYDRTQMGTSPHSPASVKSFLDDKKRLEGLAETVSICENALEPQTDTRKCQWDFPSESVAALVESKHDRVVLHEVFSAQSVQEATYSNPCAAQIEVCRALFDSKEFAALQMQLHDEDVKIVDALLKARGLDVLGAQLNATDAASVTSLLAGRHLSKALHFLNTLFKADRIARFNMGIAASTAEHQVMDFINNLLALKEQFPHFQCTLLTPESMKEVLRTKKLKSRTLFITDTPLSGAVTDSSLRIIHQRSVPHIQTEERISGSDIIGHAGYLIATQKSYGWGEYATSFVQAEANYSVETECFDNSAIREPFAGELRYWLSQGVKKRGRPQIVDGILITGSNAGAKSNCSSVNVYTPHRSPVLV